ncbi:MAG TPA: SCO1664 family protein [Anaerolineales bacterium]|nr:SCO1664 family protein [Anaerolineales bacterium]
MTDQTATRELEAVLQEGEVELQGQFMLGSNYTFLVQVRHNGREIPAVYKPARGEQPLWDFPENTLARREVAAYLVSEALGFCFVPCTVLREDVPPYGTGSLQQYIEFDPEYHYFNFSEEDKARLAPVELFDVLVNNADRKGSHVLIESSTRRLWAIDHGLCFHEEDKLRSVIWDAAGHAIPESLLATLQAVPALLEAGAPLRLDLRPYLSAAEIDAMIRRADELLRDGIFPSPPRHRRAFPYPPI